MTRGILVCVTFVLLAATFARAGDTVRLQYKFTTGEVLRYRIVSESRTYLGGDPSRLRWQSRTEDHRIEVLDVDASGAAKVRLTKEFVRQEQCDSSGCEIFDSRNPQAARTEGEKLMAKTTCGIGVPIEYRIAPDGRVTELDIDRVLDAVPAELKQDPDMAKMIEAMREAAKSGNMGAVSSFGLASFPGSDMKLGDRWEAPPRSAASPLGTVTAESASEIEGIEERKDGRRAHILSNTRTSIDTSTGTISHPTGVKFGMSPSQCVQRIVFDVEHGRLVSIESEAVRESEFSTPLDDPNSEPRRGQHFETTRTTLVEVGRRP